MAVVFELAVFLRLKNKNQSTVASASAATVSVKHRRKLFASNLFLLLGVMLGAPLYADDVREVEPRVTSASVLKQTLAAEAELLVNKESAGRLKVQAVAGVPEDLNACPSGWRWDALAGDAAALTRVQLIKVHCGSVPLVLKLRFGLMQQVWVSRGAQNRGQVLGASHVSQVWRDYRAGVAPAPQVLGQSLKRRVRDGQILTANLLESAPLVRRGQVVRLVATSGPISAALEGEVLADAALGELVRVRNIKSRKVVEGRVQDATTIAVDIF